VGGVAPFYKGRGRCHRVLLLTAGPRGLLGSALHGCVRVYGCGLQATEGHSTASRSNN
jgi:hypothetical protein